jgi:dihydropyrimidinase
MFGLASKGSLSVGADADVVIYDPNRTRTISASTHHMDVDYSCYEGRQVRGAADTVLSRGKIVVDAGEFLGSPGDGRFVKRQRSSVVAAG